MLPRPGPVRFRPAVLLLGLLAALTSAPGTAEADEEARARAQLKQLQRDMAKLSQELIGDKSQRNSLQGALRSSEVAIGDVQKEIQQTRTKIDNSQKQLKQLQLQRDELQIARGVQQELITREIRAAYQMGKQGQLKVLLNQEQPDTLARAMVYYRYFNESRYRHIEAYLEILSRIEVLEPEITGTLAALERDRKTLDRQREKLIISKKQRETDLAAIKATIRDKDSRLRSMESNRRELERLLEVIEQAIADMEVPTDYQDFSSLKGAMPWPVGSKPSNRFGRPRSSGKLRWQGWMIPAQEGTTVNAIHHGRVVFADWLRGSGLLLIIDHGNGYMSLYAHNEALLRDVGEWVSAGAPVSTVGNSGGQSSAALYFEIRKDGKPTDPGSWLKRG